MHGETENPPIVMLTYISQYLEVLCALTKDPDAEVRKLVCHSLISLLDRAGEHMLPSLESLTEFFLFTCQSDPDADVVLAACEYWNALCTAVAFEGEEVREYYITILPRYDSQP